jgi:hypothetical protein
MPPSNSISAPIKNEDSLEARNTAALPMSDGWPILAAGICLNHICFTGSTYSAAFYQKQVSIVPGDNTFTLIFLFSKSNEKPRAKEITAALAAL